MRFYDRREIRDLMAYLKLVANPADDEAFRRAVAVPRRGVGETTIEQLAEQAREARRPAARGGRPIRSSWRRCARRRAPRSASSRRSSARFRALARRGARWTSCCATSWTRIGYEDHLRAEGPEGLERIENVRELITGAAEVVADDGGEVGLTPLDHFLQRPRWWPAPTRSIPTPTR